MVEYEPYEITEEDRIVPVYNRGWVKYQPDVEDFSAALKFFLRTGIEDAGLLDENDDWEKHVQERLPGLFKIRYLNPEEALFILSDISPEYAAYRFEWHGKVYFTMRPDFGLLCIIKNLNEPPLNLYESRIRDGLFDWYVEIEAIYRAIRNKELFQGADYTSPFEEWIKFCQSRGFDISHVPRKYLRNTDASNQTLNPPATLPTASDHSNKSKNIRRESRKIKTAELHDRWQKDYRRIKSKNPQKSDSWIASQIFKHHNPEGRNSETIRKNMKK